LTVLDHRQRLFEKLREKVVVTLQDLWRPYHGSTAHREDTDGNQLVEKKKSGGHMPLNAAVMALWKGSPYRGEKGPTDRQQRLMSSRDMVARELYRLACGTPEEVVMFSVLQDLFGRYGASDSDYDHLRKKAGEYGPSSYEGRRLTVADYAINRVTERLIASGVKNRDLWADFPDAPLPRSGVRSSRSESRDQRYRRYYLLYQEERDRLQREEGVARANTKAAKNVAERLTGAGEPVTDRTIREAVGQCESGYVDLAD
jgi:hypothetical protein